MITADELARFDAYVQQYFPQYTRYKHPEDYQCTATIPASASANSSTQANVVINGVSTSSTNVPQSQIWIVKDIYTTVSTDTAVNASVAFVKNGVKTLTKSSPLSSNLVTNQTRPGLTAAAFYEPNSNFTMPTSIYAAAGTSTLTNTFFISVVIYDSTFG